MSPFQIYLTCCSLTLGIRTALPSLCSADSGEGQVVLLYVGMLLGSQGGSPSWEKMVLLLLLVPQFPAGTG